MAKSEASDYIQPIYKERALKYLIKMAGGKKATEQMSAEQLRAMKVARDKIAHDMQIGRAHV